MQINLKKSAPLKYLLENHTALPSYPTGQDFVFDILSYIVKVTIAKTKDFDQTDIKFSTKTLKYVFGEKMQEETFKDKIKLIMKDMIEDGTLIKKGEFLIINESVFLTYYEISN
jgi:hypothetical protein